MVLKEETNKVKDEAQVVKVKEENVIPLMDSSSLLLGPGFSLVHLMSDALPEFEQGVWHLLFISPSILSHM